MLFNALDGAAQRGELMLVDGGMCHWHLRRDGQVTIREIVSTRPGAGSQMLRRLEHTPGATSLFARCPAGLPSNAWYARRGFHVERAERARAGGLLMCWRKWLAWTRSPNVSSLEVIYCADGNQRKATIALDAGWLYGARLPASGLPYRPYMADQDWKLPNRTRYMAKLATHRPHMATVLDWEHPEQLPEVLFWAREAAQYVGVVIIIPKVHGGIAQLPRDIDGVPVRLGYSVPTRYGGTTVPLSEFADWPHGVHLLGGSPQRQMDIYRRLPNVRSVDTNYHDKLSANGQYWAPGTATYAANRHWPTLRESDGGWERDVPYEAMRRSCVTILQAWRQVVAAPPLPLHNEQMPLPGLVAAV